MRAWPEGSLGSKTQWAIGAVLYSTAAAGFVLWLMVAWTMSGNREQATFRLLTFSGSGLRDVLLATPAVLALLATQASFGVGLMRRRPWVRWFGMTYVLGGVLIGVLSPFIPPNSWISLVLPLLAATPTGVLLWQRQHGLLAEGSTTGVPS